MSESKLRSRLRKMGGGKELEEVIRLWVACIETREAFNKAGVHYDKVGEAYYSKAEEACNRTWVAFNKAWKVLETRSKPAKHRYVGPKTP